MLPNGDLLGGVEVGDVFYTFVAKGKIGKVDPKFISENKPKKDLKLAGASLDWNQYAEYDEFREKVLEQFAGQLATNAPLSKITEERQWYEEQ